MAWRFIEYDGDDQETIRELIKQIYAHNTDPEEDNHKIESNTQVRVVGFVAEEGYGEEEEEDAEEL